jgi:hypothetical protein
MAKAAKFNLSYKHQYTARELYDGKWMLSELDAELGKFASLAECQAAIKRLIKKEIVHFDQYGEIIK